MPQFEYAWGVSLKCLKKISSSLFKQFPWECPCANEGIVY